MTSLRNLPGTKTREVIFTIKGPHSIWEARVTAAVFPERLPPARDTGWPEFGVASSVAEYRVYLRLHVLAGGSERQVPH